MFFLALAGNHVQAAKLMVIFSNIIPILYKYVKTTLLQNLTRPIAETLHKPNYFARHIIYAPGIAKVGTAFKISMLDGDS